MRTVTVGVTSLEDAKKGLAAAFRGEAQGEFIGFASIELLWKVLAPKRWDILKAMAGQEAMTIREAGRHPAGRGHQGHHEGGSDHDRQATEPRAVAQRRRGSRHAHER